MTGVLLALAVAAAAWVRWEVRHAVPDPDERGAS